MMMKICGVKDEVVVEGAEVVVEGAKECFLFETPSCK
jgi:hypothetical protein